MKRLFILISLFVSFTHAYSQVSLDISTGLVAQSYNEVRIPNETGTLFDLYKDFKIEGPVIYFSLKPGYTFREKNHIFLLYAPLSANYKGSAPYDIVYQNTTFTEGSEISALYKFNSYRATYRRDIYSSGPWSLGVGFTAKIRDAEIRLTSGETSDTKEDFGFVPLLNLYAEYEIGNWSLFFEGDGLAGGPGRAFDLYLGGKVPVSDYLTLKAAYRMVEGGADVSDVYNFTMLHFANVGLIITL